MHLAVTLWGVALGRAQQCRCYRHPACAKRSAKRRRERRRRERRRREKRQREKRCASEHRVTAPFFMGEGYRGWWIGQHGCFELVGSSIRPWRVCKVRAVRVCVIGIVGWGRNVGRFDGRPLGRHKSRCLNRAAPALGSFCVGIETCRKRVLEHFC
jgi:hypothetical protein